MSARYDLVLAPNTARNSVSIVLAANYAKASDEFAAAVNCLAEHC